MNRIEMKEVTARGQKKDVRSLVEEFLYADVAEMHVPWKNFYKTPYSCVGSLNSSIERAGRKSQAKAVTRKGEVFLTRINSLPKEPVVQPEPEEAPHIFKAEQTSDKLAFIEVDPTEVYAITRTRESKYAKLIEEFIDSEITMANVPCKGNAKSANILRGLIQKEAKKLNVQDLMKAVVRKGNLYLVNIPKLEELKAKEAE